MATGYFLVDGGDWRFVLRQGHHRAAALRALGHARLVATPITALAVVDGQRLEPFTTDAGGLYSPTAAERLFRSQFDEDGTRRAARLGIEGAVRPA